MHPVDWHEVNTRAGYKQPPAWNNDVDADEWFDEAGDVSILRTPLDRKTTGRVPQLDQCSSNNEFDESAPSIRHEVETVLTFPLREAVSMSALLDLMDRLQTANTTTNTPAINNYNNNNNNTNDSLIMPETLQKLPLPIVKDMERRATPETHLDDIPPPFSSIKRGSGTGKQLFGGGMPLQEIDNVMGAASGGTSAPGGGRPMLVRSKRSLFDVRVSLDDTSTSSSSSSASSSDDENNDFHVEDADLSVDCARKSPQEEWE
jgi:hypothetical protein